MTSSLALYTDRYQLTMLAAYARTGLARRRAAFELFVRRLPPSRRFLVSCGIGRAIELLTSLSFSRDKTGRFTNNTGYFVPTGDPWLVQALNVPVGWWYSWRKAQHGKDEALRYFTSYLEAYPIPPAPQNIPDLDSFETFGRTIEDAHVAISDWLRHEFGLLKPSRALERLHMLDADGFVAAVRNAVLKSKKWSASDIARLKAEYAETITPAREAAAKILALERQLSDVVNPAYGLTLEEVELMWRTAPPRMPLDPAEELRRLGV